MDNPVYASQLIRFAETVSSAQVTLNEIKAHRVVGLDLGGDDLLKTQTVASSATFRTLGVNQFTIPASTPEIPAMGPRNATVATSGLLVVEIDPDNAPLVGSALTIDNQGRGSVAGVLGTNHFAVTVNNTTPVVREIVGDHATVAFS